MDVFVSRDLEGRGYEGVGVKRYRPSLDERVDEVIQDHLEGNLRKTGEMPRRKPRRHTPKPSIIYEAVRRKLRGEPRS